MKMNVYFLSTLLFLPVLIQGTSPLDKSPPRIPPPNCVDKVLNCQDFLALCENNEINRFMKEHCQKSCGHCEEGNCNSSEGFFKVPNSNNQCFKYDIKYRRSWNDSFIWCNEQGLRLAEPREPVALRKYLVNEVENWGYHDLWLGARGNGSSVHWISDGTIIDNHSDLWHDYCPCYTDPSYCLELLSDSYSLDRENSPYRTNSCISTGTAYALCELVTALPPTTTTAATTTTAVPPTTTTAATTTTTPDFCVSVGGQCLFFENELKDWNDAVESCESKGQQLVKVTDPIAFNSFMTKNYAGQIFWLGGSDIEKEGHFVWLDGSPLVTFPWGINQPDNGGGKQQDCLTWGSLKNSFDDGFCNRTYRYICELEVPNGFENFNGRIIRRTVSSDRRSSWDDAMVFCNMYGAKPFIPYTQEEYDLYKTVRYSLGSVGYMWLPANDRFEEGTLRWYNGQVATNISMWDWVDGKELADNANGHDCLKYGPAVHLVACTNLPYPPICEIL